MPFGEADVPPAPGVQVPVNGVVVVPPRPPIVLFAIVDALQFNCALSPAGCPFVEKNPVGTVPECPLFVGKLFPDFVYIQLPSE